MHLSYPAVSFFSSCSGNTKGYQKQHQFGVPLSIDENLIFKVQTEDPRNLYFTIDFYVLDHPKSLENAPYFAGTFFSRWRVRKIRSAVVVVPLYYSLPVCRLLSHLIHQLHVRREPDHGAYLRTPFQPHRSGDLQLSRHKAATNQSFGHEQIEALPLANGRHQRSWTQRNG